jgi:hypothetical protein
MVKGRNASTAVDNEYTEICLKLVMKPPGPFNCYARAEAREPCRSLTNYLVGMSNAGLLLVKLMAIFQHSFSLTVCKHFR